MTSPDQHSAHPEDVVPLYRIENPDIAWHQDGATSHEELVGQWFTPSLVTATDHLRKATESSGPETGVVDGARLVVAHVPAAELEKRHVSRHPVAAGMDVERDNYILPRDDTYPMDLVPLDETLGDLRGKLGYYTKLREAKRRVAVLAGTVAVPGAVGRERRD